MSVEVAFSLIDEPWIPVIDAAGGHELVGLADLVGGSRSLREIWSADALETLALHRLLTTLTLAALTAAPDGAPRRSLSGRAIDRIDTDGLDDQSMRAYLERWRDRFWLFGPEAFWQLGGTDVRKLDPVARLDPLRTVGSQQAFFDHRLDAAPEPFTQAQAARLLIVGQVFAIGRGAGIRDGLLGKRGMLAFPTGETVHDTMTANLVRYDANAQPDDAPVWELARAVRSNRLGREEHTPRGLLDLLSWEPRNIELVRDDDQLIRRCRYGGKGIYLSGFEERIAARRTDPWMPLRRRPKLASLAARPADTAWRDSHALLLGLLPSPDLAEAQTVLGARRAQADGRLAITLITGGVVAEGKDTLAGTLLARLPLPAGALDDLPPTFSVALEQLLADAREGRRALSRALRRFVRERDVIPRLADQLLETGEGEYWSQCEHAFHRLVRDLADDVPVAEVRKSWRGVVWRGARAALNALLEPYVDEQGLRAAALARMSLEAALPPELPTTAEAA